MPAPTEQATEHSDSSIPTRQGGSEREGGYRTIADAVAELDRRDEARKAERRAQRQAAKADAGDEAGDEETQDDDADPRRVEKPKSDAKKADSDKERKPTAKTEAKDEEDDDADPDEGDEDDDEADEADDDEQDDDDAKPAKKAHAADDDDDSVEVEHEGQKHRVPKALKDSFLRHADYTQKTQALAQDRQVVHQSYAQAQAGLQQVQQAQATLMQFAQAMLGQAPSPELAATDPGRFVLEQSNYQQRQALLNHIVEQGKLSQAEQQKLQQAEDAQRQHQHRLALDKHAPELRNPQNKAAFAQNVEHALTYFGFSLDEPIVGQFANDARVLLMVRRLLQLEHQVAGQAKAAGEVKQRLANVPGKTLKPGAADAQGAAKRGKDEARRAFMRSGRSMKDVERYLAATSKT